MAWFPVNVELEILVLVQEASTGFVDQEVVGVLLTNQVGVITMGDWGSNLNHLTGNLNEKNKS